MLFAPSMEKKTGRSIISSVPQHIGVHHHRFFRRLLASFRLLLLFITEKRATYALPPRLQFSFNPLSLILFSTASFVALRYLHFMVYLSSTAHTHTHARTCDTLIMSCGLLIVLNFITDLSQSVPCAFVFQYWWQWGCEFVVFRTWYCSLLVGVVCGLHMCGSGYILFSVFITLYGNSLLQTSTQLQFICLTT